MSLFTKIGTGLWTWEPFRRLERHADDDIGRSAKLLWIALYTTNEAKNGLPGMFVGSVTTMAESSHIPVDVTRRCLDRLLEDDLVEYDIEHRVLRMTVLPDAGESPSNGRTIRGWWRRFQNVPACTVRDRHVPVIRWILDEWCRVNGKALSNDHAVAWGETFGRLPVPDPRRVTRRHQQTDLFSSPIPSSSADPKIKTLDTNRCSTSVEQDPDQDQDQDQDLRSGSGSGGGGSGGGRTVLRLVPLSAIDADDLAEMLHEATSGKFPLALSRKQRIAIGAAIEAQASCIPTRDVLDVLRDYIAHGMPGFDPPRDQQTAEERAVRARGITPDAVATPGWITVAVQRATAWKDDADEKSAMAAQARRDLGYE